MYEIPEAFRYETHTSTGVLAGEFAAGPTGELTADEARYLAEHAVPRGLARVADLPDLPDLSDPSELEPEVQE